MREKKGPQIPGQDKRSAPFTPSKKTAHAQPKPKAPPKGGSNTRNK